MCELHRAFTSPSQVSLHHQGVGGGGKGRRGGISFVRLLSEQLD